MQRTHLDRKSWKRNTFLAIAIPLGLVSVVLPLVLWLTGYIEVHWLWITASGYCALISFWLSLFLIYLHLTSYTQPAIQQKIIRILFMVPVYALDSWIGVLLNNFRHSQDYVQIVDLARDCYEAYVIYTFFVLMLQFLGGEDAASQVIQAQGTLAHPFPFSKLKPMKLDDKFLPHCRHAIIQFMLIKPAATACAILLAFKGNYEDGNLSPSGGYLWTALITNISVTIAFTALYYFYLATKVALAPHEPLGKFLAIKAIIFLSFWQTVVIAILLKLGLIHCISDLCTKYTPHVIAKSTEEMLLCVEMMLISLAHKTVFSHKPYLALDGERTYLLASNVRNALNVDDVVEDVRRDVSEAKKELKAAFSEHGAH